VRISVEILDELYTWGKEYARRDERSMSWLLNTLLAEKRTRVAAGTGVNAKKDKRKPAEGALDARNTQ
jgi:hypothetical protein